MILDVREPAEIAQGNIPSSLPLPLSVLPEALTWDAFKWEKELGFRKPRQDQPIVVYCRSGKRSTTAKETLENADKLDSRFSKCVELLLLLVDAPSRPALVVRRGRFARALGRGAVVCRAWTDTFCAMCLTFSVRNYTGSWLDWSEKYKPGKEWEEDDD